MTRHRNAERRFSAWILACLTLVLAASGCGKSQPPDTRAADEKALRDVDAQWSAAAATKNVDAAVSYYSDNAILLPPNSPAATDKQTIRGIWSELLASHKSRSVALRRSWIRGRYLPDGAERSSRQAHYGPREVSRSLEEAGRRKMEMRCRHLQLRPAPAGSASRPKENEGPSSLLAQEGPREAAH